MQITANGNSIMEMQKSAAIETAGFQLSDKYMEVLPTGHFLRHAHGLPQKRWARFLFYRPFVHYFAHERGTCLVLTAPGQ